MKSGRFVNEYLIINSDTRYTVFFCSLKQVYCDIYGFSLLYYHVNARHPLSHDHSSDD